MRLLHFLTQWELSSQEDLVERNLKILAALSPEATTSMQRDVMEEKCSEMDGLVYEVVRMGEEYKVRYATI